MYLTLVIFLYTATLGSLLAIGIYQGVAWIINDRLSEQFSQGENLCILLPEHYVFAILLAVGASLLSAILAGMRCARIEPAEGLREL